MPVIRQMRPGDLQGCVAAFTEVYRQPPWSEAWTAQRAERYLTGFLSMRDAVGLVAEEEGGVVGALIGYPKAWWRFDELYIEEFFVLPDRQGTGIGGGLLQLAQQHCKSSGLEGIVLLTNRTYPARQFYEKHGFELDNDMRLLYKTL